MLLPIRFVAADAGRPWGPLVDFALILYMRGCILSCKVWLLRANESVVDPKGVVPDDSTASCSTCITWKLPITSLSEDSKTNRL